jgi:hypothetical protein
MRRRIKMPPRLWFGFWMVWSTWFALANSVHFAAHLARLPHEHWWITFAATMDFWCALLCAAVLNRSVRRFIEER